MRFRSIFPCVAFSLILLWLAGSAAAAAPIFGTVLKSGGQPLAKAEVELLRPGTEKVVYRALTDAKGKFALPKVAAGSYEVRVKYGRVLKQSVDGKTVERRKLAVGEQPVRLPSLRVK